ncbi:MAG: acetyl-CoA C-acetyltransferase [Deltaproteobacteria bacterium]|nr:acetyl-CoA C-acetyltransferase [Deltaproteobacteria bacterium]
MKPVSNDLVILSAKRTAFGTFGGTLKDKSATDLGVVAAKAALEQAKVTPDQIEHVVFGNVVQTSPDAIYLARHIGLKVGAPQNVPAVTVNRLCGSGFEALTQAAALIMTGQANVVLAGGTESMSQAPHIIRGARWGIPLGKGGLEDSLTTSLTDSFTGLPMGITAENLAEQYKISQDEVDAYSVLTQKRFAAAQEGGRLANEITPVELVSKKGSTFFAKDEHNRPDTTLEGLKKLPKVFKKDGVVHPGAASGISDGAGAFVLAHRAWAEKGLTPIGKLLGWGVVGCDPKVMGIGPAPAIRQLLEKTGATMKDVSLVEVNEAFVPQYLAVEKELGLDRETTNVDGGATAVGHPLAASGSRITAHLLYELKRRGQKYGIGSACIGGGQGIAVLVEAI